MKKLKTILAICTVTVMITSCGKGEQGDPGPQGAQGSQGPQGEPGPTGPQGNANCDFYPIALPLSLYSGPTSSNHSYYETVTGLPQINDNDMLLAYLYERWDGSSYEWGALPGQHYYTTGSSYNDHYFSISNGGTTYVYVRNSSGSQPYTTMTGYLNYRFFIIKDAQRIGSSTTPPKSLNIKNINEVMKYYSIKDIPKN